MKRSDDFEFVISLVFDPVNTNVRVFLWEELIGAVLMLLFCGDFKHDFRGRQDTSKDMWVGTRIRGFYGIDGGGSSIGHGLADYVYPRGAG